MESPDLNNCWLCYFSETVNILDNIDINPNYRVRTNSIKLTYISKSVVIKLLSENKELMLQRKMILDGVGNSD